MVGQPMVVVGDNHQAVSAEVVLLPKHPRPDLLVELNRPFVGACDDHEVVLSVLGMKVHQQIFEFLAKHPLQPLTASKCGIGAGLFTRDAYPYS